MVLWLQLFNGPMERPRPIFYFFWGDMRKIDFEKHSLSVF